MSGFEQNEISKNSNGGTELSTRSIQSSLPSELLEHFQIIPSRPRELQQDKIRVLALHDLSRDPEVEKLKYESERDKYHKFIFVSNWQMNEFVNHLGMPLNDKMQVIENPITPFEYEAKTFDKKINLVYFSTPQRGLELLVPVFEKLCETHNNIHLDVYSSFEIYGWKEKDEQYKELYNRIDNNPNMTYFGYADQHSLREDIKKSHILAYSSIWSETSCRVLIESMSAGLLCVHPNLAALSETSGGLTVQYQFMQDPNEHANQFYKYLHHAIKVVSQPDIQKYLRFVKSYADTRYNLPKISSLWKSILEELVQKYPTPESRQFTQSTQMFRYSA